MKQEDLIKLSQSWMARDVVMAQRFGLSKTLADKARGMFFRQGLCNSNQGTGIFTDQYQRCAFIKDPARSLLYLAVQALSKKIGEENVFFIPLSDDELGVSILQSHNVIVQDYFKCSVKKIPIGAHSVPCLRAALHLELDTHAKQQALFDLLKYMANWGALATQDRLIDILIELEQGDLQKDDAYNLHLAIVNDNIKISVHDLIKLLRQAPRHSHLSPADSKCYQFYCAFLERFIQSYYQLVQLNYDHFTLEMQLLHMQSLRRLYIKLLVVQNHDSTYHACMTALELAFDEIANMLTVLNPYTEYDLFAAIKTFISDSLAIGEYGVPTSVAMTGSCMQMIHRKLSESLKYLNARNNSEACKVYVMGDVYYEVCKAHDVAQDFEHDKLVTYHGLHRQNVRNYADEIVDLMLLNFHANVNRRKRGFVGHDVIAIIKQQCNLRAQQQDAKQLIVILDGTMTDLSGQHMRRLLHAFQDQITSGLLAIFLITSLNKYCQIGFDRFPSGIAASFYSKNAFPTLSDNQLVGFVPCDAIPQTLTHFLRNVGDNVTSYYRMVHQFSRNLYDDLVPAALYSDKQPIHIDYPYTKDGYNKPWGFMVIRFANKQLVAEYKPKLQEFLNSVGIEYRDGFGFNRSTYSSIGVDLEILRISIGPNATIEQFAKIVQFIENANNNINNPKVILRARL